MQCSSERLLASKDPARCRRLKFGREPRLPFGLRSMGGAEQKAGEAFTRQAFPIAFLPYSKLRESPRSSLIHDTDRGRARAHAAPNRAICAA